MKKWKKKPATAVFVPCLNAEEPNAPLAMVCRRCLTGTPLLRIRVEVAVRSRAPEIRPASEMISGFVIRFFRSSVSFSGATGAAVVRVK